MQQYSLRKEAKQYLKSNRHGGLKARRFRSHVITKLTQDTYALKRAPRDWQSFDDEHLKQLVTLWRKQRIQPATMLNHLTVIRKFLNDMDNQQIKLTNKQLGVVRSAKRKRKLEVSQNFWQDIDNPVVRSIIALQTNFGQTYSEAIRIKPLIHTQQDSLWLTREITFNSQDRIVPFRDQTQARIINALKALTHGPYSLLDVYGDKAIQNNMQKTLTKLRLPTTKSWRYLYAKWVNDELSTTLSQYKLNWLIMDEMGLKSRTSLWRYLNEQ